MELPQRPEAVPQRQRRAPISAQGNALGLRRKNLQALKGRAKPVGAVYKSGDIHKWLTINHLA